MTEPVHRSGSFAALEESEPFPGVHRHRFDADGATVSRYRFDPGARFPMHRHVQEQITLVEDGEVTFTVAGEPLALGPGDWSVVAPNCEHGLTAGPGGATIVAIVMPRRTGAVGYEIVDGPAA